MLISSKYIYLGNILNYYFNTVCPKIFHMRKFKCSKEAFFYIVRTSAGRASDCFKIWRCLECNIYKLFLWSTIYIYSIPFPTSTCCAWNIQKVSSLSQRKKICNAKTYFVLNWSSRHCFAIFLIYFEKLIIPTYHTL